MKSFGEDGGFHLDSGLVFLQWALKKLFSFELINYLRPAL